MFSGATAPCVFIYPVRFPLALFGGFSDIGVFVQGKRWNFLQGAKTTGANTDTRPNPLDYYKTDPNHQISMCAMVGVDAFNDFMDYFGDVSWLKREEGTRGSILEIKSIMRRGVIDANNSHGVSGGLMDRISRLIFGQTRKYEVELEALEAKNALLDFAKISYGSRTIAERQTNRIELKSLGKLRG